MLFYDRRFELLRHALEQRVAAPTELLPGEQEAAVALLLRAREQLELLLIRRAVHERDPWSGHIALPGGRRSIGDENLVDTAMRETEEEVGVPLRREGTLLGVLDTIAPRNPHLPPLTVAPFVFAVPPATEAEPDRTEVAAALWVPLAALRSEEAASEVRIELSDETRKFPSLVYGDYVIWGLTHRILTQFLELAEAHGL